MAEETTKTIRFRADTEELKSALADLETNLEGFSGSEIELAKATREANKALEEQAKAAGVSKAELLAARKAIDSASAKSAKAAEDASSKSAKAAAESARSISMAGKMQIDGQKAVRESQLELLELFGGPSKDTVDKLGKATATLGADYVLLAGAAGVMAGAVLAGVAVFAALGAGAISAAYSAGDLARGLAEIKGLGSLEGFGVDQKEIDSFNNLNGTIDALGVIVDRAMINFGTVLGPGLEKVGMIAVKFGLMALDAWNALAQGGQVIPKVATFISKMLIESMTLGISSMAEMAAVAGHMAKAMGMDGVGDKLIGIRDAWDQTQESLAADIASYAIEKTVFVLDELDKGTASYDERAQALTGTLVKNSEATRNAGDAAKNAADQRKKEAEAIARAKKELEEWNKTLQETEKFSREQIKTFDGAIDTLWEMADTATDVGLSDHERALKAIDDARSEATAKAKAMLETALLATSTDAGRETAYAAHQAAMETIDKNHAEEKYAAIVENNKKIGAENKKAADEEKKLQQEKKDNMVASVEAGLQLASELVGQMGDVVGDYLAKFTDALSETMDQLSSVRDGLSELGNSGVNAAKLTGDALMQAYLDGEVSLDQLSDAQKANLETSLKAEEKYLQKKAKAEREAAMKAFKMQKATSIAEALINSALAVIAAFKLGPIAGGIAAPIIAGLTGAQVALIMNQEPSFHQGGGIGQISSAAFQSKYAPDEVGIKAQVGEGVVSRIGMDVIGEQSLRDLNRGRPPGMGVVNVTQIYDGKVIGQAVQDQLKTSSALRRSTSTSRPGHRIK